MSYTVDIIYIFIMYRLFCTAFSMRMALLFNFNEWFCWHKMPGVATIVFTGAFD